MTGDSTFFTAASIFGIIRQPTRINIPDMTGSLIIQEVGREFLSRNVLLRTPSKRRRLSENLCSGNCSQNYETIMVEIRDNFDCRRMKFLKTGTHNCQE